MTQTTEVFETETATTIKNSNEYIEFLENSTQDNFTKEEVLEVLKGFKVKGNGQRRGQLAGLTLEAMTDDQLKRELINSKSVLYKAQQRGAAAESIERNQIRVDAALAEKAARTPEVAEVEETATNESDVYVDQETADEI